MKSKKSRISLLSNTDRDNELFFWIKFLSSLVNLVLGHTLGYGPTTAFTR